MRQVFFIYFHLYAHTKMVAQLTKFEIIIFSSKNNPIQEEILKNWGIQTITNDIDNPGESLEMFLKELTFN